MPVAPFPALRHDGCFFDSRDALVGATGPFLREGIAADDGVVVACSQSNAPAVTAQLDDPRRLTLLSRDELFSAPSTVLASYRRLVQQHRGRGSGRLRLVAQVGFPDAHGRDGGSWEALAAFETLCNQVLPSLPLWSLCAYDTTALDRASVATGRLTHAHVWAEGRRTANPGYVPPEGFLATAPPDAGGGEGSADLELVLTELTDLHPLRSRLQARLLSTGGDFRAVDDLVLAVNEIATNALRHGRGPVVVWAQVTARHAVCSVRDHGAGFDAAPASAREPGPPERHMGLELARRLVHELSFARTEDGFTVRLVGRLRSG